MVIKLEGIDNLVLAEDSLSQKELSSLVADISKANKGFSCPSGLCEFTILWYDYIEEKSFMVFEKAKDGVEAAYQALNEGKVPKGVNFSVYPVRLPEKVRFKPSNA